MANPLAKTLLASLLLALLTTQSVAHTTVIGTTPKSGSKLQMSPPLIEIVFRDPVRLTSVVALTAGTPERKLAFTPTDSAAKFTLNDPKLATGRTEIQWKALSKDGHVLTGSLNLTIEPTVAKSN